MIYLLGVVGAVCVSLYSPRAERVVIPTLPNLARIGFSPAASSTHNKWSAAVLADEQGQSLDECMGKPCNGSMTAPVVGQSERRSIDRLRVTLSKG